MGSGKPKGSSRWTKPTLPASLRVVGGRDPGPKTPPPGAESLARNLRDFSLAQQEKTKFFFPCYSSDKQDIAAIVDAIGLEHVEEGVTHLRRRSPQKHEWREHEFL